jgi:phage terminase large subunit-like protein
MISKNYILTYYQQIRDGSVTVGTWIQKWYEYIVHGLEEKKFFFDQKKAARAIAFIQQYCRHHEGPLAPQLITLEVWQKALISVIFGVIDKDGLRQFREVFVVMGRKNGKTLLDAAIACYMMIADGEYGARAYFCAPKLDQSRLAFEAFYQMISKDTRLSVMAKKRRTDVYFAESNSSAMPVAFSEKKTDGLNPSYVSLDELASWRGDAGLKQYEVFKSALGARSQPMMFGISTAGYENEGIYDELIKRSTSVLNGTSKETRLAPFLYIIDDVEKWNDINELKKSNPNLGVSTTVDYLLEEIAIAEGSISKKLEFLTKYCNIKQSSALAWFPAETVRKMFGFSRTLEEFRNHYCLGGIDLSQTTDLTSACVLIEKEGILWVHSHFWLPAERLQEATQRDGIPYQVMIERGFLSLSGDEFIDYHDVFNWFMDLVRVKKIFPLQVGYDRYTAQYLVQDLEQASFHMESVFQGWNLTNIEDTFEGMLREGRIRCMDDNDLLKIHMLDAAQQIETNTSAHPRKKLVKLSKNAHVDGVAAILDAMCMRANHWAEMGGRLQNVG